GTGDRRCGEGRKRCDGEEGSLHARRPVFLRCRRVRSHSREAVLRVPNPYNGGGDLLNGAMADLRHDPMSGRWVAVAPDRARRPGAGRPANDSPETCPFCAGHEDRTPPETLRLGEGPSGWEVRVVPNLYPALERQEVVVHGHGHALSVAELPDATLELVAEAWQRPARDIGGHCFPL